MASASVAVAAPLRDALWSGRIPLQLLLDQREVTSLYAPHPLFLLVPRMLYLPCFLDEIVHHFGNAAVEARQTMWCEDTATGQPIRWHLPLGVLYDLYHQTDPSQSLPWRLTVHFHRFPHRQVLLFDTEDTVRKAFINAMKQALHLQHGSAKVGMDLPKDLQLRLWSSLLAVDGAAFAAASFGTDDAIKRVPVRVCIPHKPAIQVPMPSTHGGQLTTVAECVQLSCGAAWDAVHADRAVTVQGISIGLSAPVLHLWQLLHSADRFLYIIVAMRHQASTGT